MGTPPKCSPFRGPFKLALISVIVLLPFASSESQYLPSSTGSIKKISEREREVLPLIEELANKLDFNKFTEDPLILQKPPETRYLDPKRNNLIFAKKNDAEAKQTIALSSKDSASWAITTPRGGKKRQFILLRKALSQGETAGGSGIPYYASFVYIRNRLDSDNETNTKEFQLLGVPSVAEWDIWEERYTHFYAGWETCDFTLYFTCSSLKAMAGDAVKALVIADNKKQSLSRSKRSIHSGSNAIDDDDDDDDDDESEEELEPLLPIKSVDGSDPNEYNDLYLDLDLHRFEEDDDEPKRLTRLRRSLPHHRVKRHGWPEIDEEELKNNEIGESRPGGRMILGDVHSNLGVDVDDVMKDVLNAGDGDSRVKVAMTVLTGLLRPDGPLANLTASDIAGSTVDLVSSVLKGPHLGTLKTILGPSGTMLDPLIEVVGSGAELVRDLPDQSAGFELKGAIANIAEAAGIGGLMESMGLGRVLESMTHKGADGQRMISWDYVGQLASGVKKLMASGSLSKEAATLAALAEKLTEQTKALSIKGVFAGWRLGSDLAGGTLNGGARMGNGFGLGKKNVPSNADLLTGIIYPGAGTKKQFFFPLGTLHSANFVSDGARTIHGWYEPSLPGKADGFYPDGFYEEPAKELVDKRGKIIPDGYKPKKGEEGDGGIVGTLKSDNKFVPEGITKRAVVNMNNEKSKEKFWMPGTTNSKIVPKPAKTAEEQNPKTVLYGVLFPGIEESPHIFIPDGGSLTGFFVPEDEEDHPQYTQTPHGILTPTTPAGHAMFVAETPEELDNIKEIHGVFMPDALKLAGGIGGTLSKMEGGHGRPGKYSFVADKPGIDYMYISGTPEVGNVWNVYLSKKEWTKIPPAIPPVPPPAPPKAKKGAGKPQGRSLGETEEETEQPEKIYGVQVTTKKNSAFLPLATPIAGRMILIDLKDSKIKYGTFSVKVTVDRPDTPFKVEIIKEESKGDKKATGPVLVMYRPTDFPKGDAIMGVYAPTKNFLTPSADTANPHFWSPSESLWVPVELSGGTNTTIAKKKKKKKKKPKAIRTKKKKKTTIVGELPKGRSMDGEDDEGGNNDGNEEDTVPGVVTGTVASPFKLDNYAFGPLYDDSAPEMVEEVIDTLPHEYTPGVFYVDNDSPAPVFVADGGAQAVIELDEDMGALEGFLFPHKGDKPPSFVLESTEESIEAATIYMVGKIGTLDRSGSPLKGFFRAVVNGTRLEVESTSEWSQGWLQTDLAGVEPQELPSTASISISNFKRTKPELKYALVDIGGGFKGVVIENKDALNDANNPIFQEYLHYRAQRNGDIFPWGHVYIIDPISKIGDQQGSLATSFDINNGSFSSLVRGFSLTNWEYTKTSSIKNEGVQMEAMKVADRQNIASMMDFRAYLYHKYTCKIAQSSTQERLLILTPLAAEPFLNLKAKATPRKLWLNAVGKSGDQLAIPKQEAVGGLFSAQFGIDIETVLAFTRDEGKPISKFPGKGKAPKPDAEITNWKASAPWEKWGDKYSCDEIILDDFQIAQTVAATTHQGQDDDQGVTGMDLGLKLVQGYGENVSYTDVAYQLILNVKKKQAEKKRSAGGTVKTTDLMGNTQSKVQKTAGKLIELNKEVAQAEAKPKEEDETKKKGVIRKGKKKSRRPAGRAFGTLDPELDAIEHSKSLRGWKTQHRPPVPNITLSYSGIIFYGLGNCEQKDLPDINLWKSGEPLKVIEYYLKVLRTDCMEKASDRITELVNTGILMIYGNDAFFRIPIHHPLIRQPRLTPKEMKQLSLAFEFHAFTKTYHILRTEKGFPTSGVLEESHGIISRSGGFLTELTYYILSKARRFSPEHSVRITRNLLRTLRTVMTKTRQDSFALEKCADCTFDKEVVEGDKFRVMSLIQFIIHGMGPFERGSWEVKPLFLDFVNINKEAIWQRVREFERQFPNSEETPEHAAERQVEEISKS